ncbi:MAG: glycosyltransferase family 9 protein [Verrucomicrobia bacterium]|nr:glycosyltransferase family 9 protein [Verrucomicrobiota bacterium]MDE3100311.1 glycosyltransferase family 9 protein [Verrucomicrobiota bacterium]
MKILVISLAGIGDTLLATPLIHELRANFPDATIDALVLWGGSRDLLANNPHLNGVHQKNLIQSGRTEAVRFLWSLRRSGYDVSINTHPQSRIHYRIAARVIGAPLRLSHEYECFGWLDRRLVNKTLPQDYTRPTIENNLDFLPLLGGRKKLPSHEMEIFLAADEEKWAGEFLVHHKLEGRKILGIHAGSGGTKNLPLKRWPIRNHAGLVRRLNRERPDVRVLLFGGPEEGKEHQIILAQSNRDLTMEARTQNLRQTAALMRRCTAFLSVDTALMHLAAAVKTRGQIVIEAPTLNATNVPVGNDYTLVKNPVIAGRNLDYYRYDGGDIKGTRDELLSCMASITIEAVLETVKRQVEPDFRRF